jgi:hypothetical protein
VTVAFAGLQDEVMEAMCGLVHLYVQPEKLEKKLANFLFPVERLESLHTSASATTIAAPPSR